MSGLPGPPLRIVPGETDQVPRLHQFRRDHADVVIDSGSGWWQARIPEPAGERVITRYTLRELLDKLDQLTAPSPGPGPS
jgi:hypothetical protein